MNKKPEETAQTKKSIVVPVLVAAMALAVVVAIGAVTVYLLR